MGLLGAEDDTVDKVLFMEQTNLILATCDDTAVRIYDCDTDDGLQRNTFEFLVACVVGPVELDKDLFVSEDTDGSLYTWKPSIANKFVNGSVQPNLG